MLIECQLFSVCLGVFHTPLGLLHLLSVFKIDEQNKTVSTRAETFDAIASGRCMNMVKMTMNELRQELTAEELLELEAAEKKEPAFDDDSPMLMREQLMQFKRMNSKG